VRVLKVQEGLYNWLEVRGGKLKFPLNYKIHAVSYRKLLLNASSSENQHNFLLNFSKA
jgi:hypothetical protein